MNTALHLALCMEELNFSWRELRCCEDGCSQATVVYLASGMIDVTESGFIPNLIIFSKTNHRLVKKLSGFDESMSMLIDADM